jgi:hypothetical protein
VSSWRSEFLRRSAALVAGLVLGLLLARCNNSAKPALGASDGAGGASALAPAATAPTRLTETQKIERLIAYVVGLKDAKFVRKGQAYDTAAAVEFLRAKWQANSTQVHTARDFVDLASGGNMGTGTPYYILLADASQIPIREVLTLELDRIEGIPHVAAAATRP